MPKLTKSPTTLSEKLLELEGAIVGRTELFVPGRRGLKRDLFGFCDLCFVQRETTGFVQVTDTDHLADRLKKIAQEPRAAVVAAGDHRVVEAHGWCYLGRGMFLCRRVHWTPQSALERHFVIREEKGVGWEYLGEVEAE